MKDQLFAQILKGLIVNILVINDPAQIPLFSQGFDALVPLLGLVPQPDIGWSYDGKNFSPPVPGPSAPLTFTPNYSTALPNLWRGNPPLTLHAAVERLTAAVAQFSGGQIPTIPGDIESVPFPDPPPIQQQKAGK